MKLYLPLITALAIGLLPIYSYAGNVAGAFGITQFNGTVDDPDGSTDSSSKSTLSLILTYNFDNHWRLWTELSQYELDLSYGVNEIGQQVDTLQFDTILQRAYSFDTFTYGWIGAGLGIGLSEYNNRAKVLDTGFLDPDNQFDDRDETNIHVILNAGILRGLTEHVTIGANLKHHITINEGIEGTSLTGYVSYQF